MALHPDFPGSPHAVIDPEVRWFLADEARFAKQSRLAWMKKLGKSFNMVNFYVQNR